MNWRRWTVLGLVAFAAAVVVMSLLPWTWHGSLEVPPGVGSKTVSVQCGSIWGSATVKPPANLPYPISGTPCSQRGEDQVMSGVDILLAGAGLAFMARYTRRHASHSVI